MTDGQYTTVEIEAPVEDRIKALADTVKRQGKLLYYMGRDLDRVFGGLGDLHAAVAELQEHTGYPGK